MGYRILEKTGKYWWDKNLFPLISWLRWSPYDFSVHHPFYQFKKHNSLEEAEAALEIYKNCQSFPKVIKKVKS